MSEDKPVGYRYGSLECSLGPGYWGGHPDNRGKSQNRVNSKPTMTSGSFKDSEKLEADLWEAAHNLGAKC